MSRQPEGANGDNSPKMDAFEFDMFSTPEPGTTKGTADGEQLERKKRLVAAKTTALKGESGKNSTGSGSSEGAAEAAGGGSSSVHVTVELPTIGTEGAEAEPVLSTEEQERFDRMEGGKLFGVFTGHLGTEVPVPGTPRTVRYWGGSTPLRGSPSKEEERDQEVNSLKSEVSLLRVSMERLFEERKQSEELLKLMLEERRRAEDREERKQYEESRQREADREVEYERVRVMK